jgi:hypothetical protein
MTARCSVPLMRRLFFFVLAFDARCPTYEDELVLGMTQSPGFGIH